MLFPILIIIYIASHEKAAYLIIFHNFHIYKFPIFFFSIILKKN